MEITQQEIHERLAIIESMMREGRRTTEYWGWMFLLWGIGYVVAISWSLWLPHAALAWPVTMVTTALIGILVSRARRKGRPVTARSRSVGGVWAAAGTSIFIFAFAVSLGGHVETHSFMAAIEVIIGLACAASSIALRWKTQFGVALVWWAAAAGSCFTSTRGVLLLLIAANLIGNIGFGIYLMVLESRAKARTAAAQVSHA